MALNRNRRRRRRTMKTINNLLSLLFKQKTKKTTLLSIYMNSVTNESWIDGIKRNGQIIRYISYK